MHAHKKSMQLSFPGYLNPPRFSQVSICKMSRTKLMAAPLVYMNIDGILEMQLNRAKDAPMCQSEYRFFEIFIALTVFGGLLLLISFQFIN